ncbi:uncharacterized protein [Antedon mediterranea]|uniref:uncharacterized protein n=1 Tax=Antedon mediterranea TaxID=105859 RepID=UPI003AF8D4B6
MDFIQILSVILILWSITGTFGNQQPLLDFISYTNRASATDTGENDAGYILVGFSIIPDITEDLFIGLALSPLLDGTHYDVEPEVRSASSTSSINGDISTLFDSGTTVYYTDKDTYSSFRIDFTNDQELPDRVGVFYLGAQKDGFRTAVINMPMQSQNANVRPTRSVMTASVGDATLTISVETDESSLRWRKDGGTEITDWNDIATVTITNVRLADAGLYECYVTGSRSEGLHAFIVIHVRDCPASKWSPPFCQSSCPVCYNGGICDVYLGSCLCLTGFTGDNCETSYGGNHFGFNGYVLCTANVEEKCSGKLFCGQDPIGCGCASGWKDVDCSTECESGKYGPGCMFDCHCADSDCDHSSGCNVTSVCDEGFEGERCLTPTGLQCNDGFHGVFCDLSCHCANSEACNKTDGSCPGNCEDGWAGSDCLLALPALYNAPSIELRASSVLIVWTAWNQTQDIGSAEVNSYVLKYWKLSAKDDAITINNITELQIEFNISSIEYNTTYKATVSVNTDVLGVITQGIPSPVLQFGPIEPPSFLFHPCTYTRSSNHSTILTCDTWNHEVHIGMGVVRGYTVEYWITVVPQDVYSIVVTEPIASQHYTILLPEVANYYSYQVTVLVNYEYNGTDMVGPRSPVMNISKENIPDITGFSSSFIVSNGGEIDMRSYTGTEDGVNLNVNFGVGLWVDDNGTHFGENEFKSQDGDVANSIFTTTTSFTPCVESMISVRCQLKFPNSVGVRRIGVKYMSTEFNGIVVSTSMVFLARGAPIVAEHRTISTSIGESVELVLTLDGIDDTTLRWKKNGDTADISEWDGLSHVTLGNVRRKDDGIYECYQEGHRDEGQHAIVRVIVRECPRGKWLPPDCELDCPVCYNGGVCTEFGSCICPPGFKGDHCEEACGINNWGRDCTILCNSRTPGCPGKLYSLPDPYGCSCFSGYEGIECENEKYLYVKRSQR